MSRSQVKIDFHADARTGDSSALDIQAGAVPCHPSSVCNSRPHRDAVPLVGLNRLTVEIARTIAFGLRNEVGVLRSSLVFERNQESHFRSETRREFRSCGASIAVANEWSGSKVSVTSPFNLPGTMKTKPDAQTSELRLGQKFTRLPAC